MTSDTKEKWEIVIGLEIHAQVNSKSKLFSGHCSFITHLNMNALICHTFMATLHSDSISLNVI